MRSPRLFRGLYAAHPSMLTPGVATILAFALASGSTSAVATPMPATKAHATESSVVDMLQPTPELLDLIERFAREQDLPDSVRTTLRQLIGFIRSSEGNADKPGIAIPENAPPVAQFGWPTLAPNCMAGTAQAMGTAVAIPGPATLPLPGVPSGHTSFIFTALGTGPATDKQSTAMRVNWINISTKVMGHTLLTRGLVNPEGPGTLTGVAKTGTGTVLAVLSGGISTQERTSTMNCEFAPTIGLVNVR